MDEVRREALRGAVRRLAEGQAALAERFCSQVEFAEAFLALHPRRRASWRRLLGKAWAVVEGAVAAGRADGLGAAVAEAEDILAPVGKVAKTYTVHCVGHAHIDMNWMWSWPETVSVTHDTFRTVLRLMEEFDDFCFTQSQASVYAICRDYHPDLFEQVRRRVAEGRWEVAAVQWVEGDKNLAGGESLARHLLYTRRFFAEHFDLRPEDVPLDWEPDTFGHAATIPTIVSRGGVRRYYLCRGGKFAKPPVFRWRGPDGSEVLVNLETTWYNDHLGPHNALAAVAFWGKVHVTDWMCVYGVGDHGGGPTRRDIRRCHEMNAWPVYPTFRLATTGRYYEALEARAAELPELSGELNFEFTGCYTTQTRIKRTNRLAEHLLGFAESAAAVAWRAAGRPYPGRALREAWVDAVFGHFHDILPGSGVRETREYHMGLFQRTAATAQATATGSLVALADAVDTSGFAAAAPDAEDDAGMAMGAGAGRGSWWGDVSAAAHAAAGSRVFLAFNPTAWARTETLKVLVWDRGDGAINDQAFVARFADGSAVPAQRLAGAAAGYWGHRFVPVAVPVRVGGLGHTAFAVEPAGRHIPAPAYAYPPRVVGAINQVRHSPSVTCPRPLAMENEHLRVRIDPLTGGLVELVEKASGLNLVEAGAPAGLLEYILERPGGMSAWVIHPTQRRQCPLEATSVEATAAGPHLAAVMARVKVNDSTATLTWSLAAGSRRLELAIEVDWLERGSPAAGTPQLRLRVPLALTGAKGRYEVPFGSVERALAGGEEVPALRWADVTGRARGGRRAGCALLNDSKYGHALDGSVLTLTLIRSSYEPDPLPELGRHEVRVALMPHAGSADVAELVRAGTALNQPLRAVATEAHPGRLAPVVEGVTVRPAGVVLSAVKKAEDDDALIFRLHEAVGRATTARVRLAKELFGSPAGAVEVDLLERAVSPSTARVVEGGFGVHLPAAGIASVKVAFRK